MAEPLRGGGPAAAALDLERAYEEHAGRVARFLVRLGFRPSEAEDLCAETFLVAHERRDRFDATRPPLPWLLGIAVNLGRRQRRRRWVQDLLAAALLRGPSAEDDAGPGAEQQMIEAEDAARVRRALASIPERKREVLVLREYEGLSAKEIGDALQMPEATVYSSLHYARKAFLKRYRQLVVLEGPP